MDTAVLVAAGSIFGLFVWWVLSISPQWRLAMYRSVFVPVLLSYELWESAYRIRKNLEGITTWLHGSVFTGIKGSLLAHLCLSMLQGYEDPRSPNLVRTLEIIKRYGSIGQIASFQRAVARGVIYYAPALAPAFLDVMVTHGFKISPKRRAAVELQALHALRHEAEDSSPLQGEARFIGAVHKRRRNRVRRAYARTRAYSPTPRRSHATPQGARGAGDSGR